MEIYTEAQRKITMLQNIFKKSYQGPVGFFLHLKENNDIEHVRAYLAENKVKTGHYAQLFRILHCTTHSENYEKLFEAKLTEGKPARFYGQSCPAIKSTTPKMPAALETYVESLDLDPGTLGTAESTRDAKKFDSLWNYVKRKLS